MLRQSLAAEAIGTFAFCLVGGGAILTSAAVGGGPGLVGIALAHGIMLSVAVSACMNFSGGHINPAVTIAMMSTGRIDPVTGFQYVIAQLIGGMAAGVLLANVIFAGVDDPSVEGTASVVETQFNGTPNYGTLLGANGMLKAILIEALATFILIYAIFGTAVDPRHPNLGGFGIGLTVAALILFCGPLTGASMNPARTFGTGFLMGERFWSQQLVYWIGPILGAVTAAWTYDCLILKKEPRDA
jgi:MIP family channel proteins